MSKSDRLAAINPQRLITRMFEEPRLVEAIQALEPQTLGKLIDHFGLEDAGEIVSLATTDQLIHMFDEDLWKSEGGLEEKFDADRFALWLEIMLESGESFVAQKLAELPEELVMLAFHRNVLVVDLSRLEIEMSSRRECEVDLTDKALQSCLGHEFGEYLVISRKHERWDAVVTALAALYESNCDFLMRILDRCCGASTEYIEENGGLYDVLTSEEMMESDAQADREDRRAALGFISPSDAAGFLKLALIEDLGEIIRSDKRDPVTRSYFRELEAGARPGLPQTGKVAGARAGAGDRLVGMLKEAGIVEQARPVPLLSPKGAKGPKKEGGLFRQSMAKLAQTDPGLYSQRMSELAYLANVLCAGCTIFNRGFRPFEAVETAIALCELGFERLSRRTSESADKLFRVGWKVLHEDHAADAERYRIKSPS